MTPKKAEMCLSNVINKEKEADKKQSVSVLLDFWIVLFVLQKYLLKLCNSCVYYILHNKNPKQKYFKTSCKVVLFVKWWVLSYEITPDVASPG